MAVCYTARHVCAAVNTYTHQFFILNANTVTCKHVFQLNIRAVCSSPRGRCWGWEGGGEASRIHLDKSTSGPRRVSIGKAGVVRQDKVKALQDWKRLTIRSRTTSGRSNPTSMRPVVLECGSGSMFTIASAHFTWHGRTKGQITIQRIHMNAVFKETHPHPN